MGKPLLKRIAEKVLGSEYAELIWKRVEILGDIAVIRKSYSIDIPIDVFKALGEELLKELPYVKSVWLAVTPVHGSERIREYVHIAGERRSETLYKEHGCIFKVDITKVYISPVLGFDHMRIAKQVREGEKILNMFAGFCPYSIIASKYGKPRYVVSIDINEYATYYARINIELNKVSAVNEVINGDALIITSALGEKFDRVLMPYPDLFEEALKVSVYAVKEGGFLHPHLFIEGDNKRIALENAYRTVIERLHNLGVVGKIIGGHVIRSIAPRKYHITVDVYVEKKKVK
jgi:tRNA (guanine37-N1)-methyltransferase